MKIAILGAESTGKSQLAAQLQEHVQAIGKSALLVPEYLRTWCDKHQRTPQAEEQHAIALEQIRQIDTAYQAKFKQSEFNDSVDYLIADTTALTVAVYSDVLFNDTSLYEMALTHQHSFDVTLLMGLDVPWVADGIQRDGAHMREPVDAAIRRALLGAGIPFEVVYGSDDTRLQHALQCLNLDSDAKAGKTPSTSPNRSQRLRNWVCERCSDPECEHRIFRSLLG